MPEQRRTIARNNQPDCAASRTDIHGSRSCMTCAQILNAPDNSTQWYLQQFKNLFKWNSHSASGHLQIDVAGTPHENSKIKQPVENKVLTKLQPRDFSGWSANCIHQLASKTTPAADSVLTPPDPLRKNHRRRVLLIWCSEHGSEVQSSLPSVSRLNAG